MVELFPMDVQPRGNVFGLSIGIFLSAAISDQAAQRFSVATDIKLARCFRNHNELCAAAKISPRHAVRDAGLIFRKWCARYTADCDQNCSHRA
jgi:hypothetical protein